MSGLKIVASLSFMLCFHLVTSKCAFPLWGIHPNTRPQNTFVKIEPQILPRPRFCFCSPRNRLHLRAGHLRCLLALKVTFRSIATGSPVPRIWPNGESRICWFLSPIASGNGAGRFASGTIHQAIPRVNVGFGFCKLLATAH